MREARDRRVNFYFSVDHGHVASAEDATDEQALSTDAIDYGRHIDPETDQRYNSSVPEAGVLLFSFQVLCFRWASYSTIVY